MLDKFSASVAGALMAIAFSAPALAAPMLVYVSTRGTDAPGCGTLAAPCRQLQAAQETVAPGGYINILDAGEYEAFAVLKSINVVNESNGAALLRAAASPGATAAVGTVPQRFGVNDVLRLRGLTLEGRGGFTVGVVVNSHGRLELVDCVVRNAQTGIALQNTFQENLSFAFHNTTVANNSLSGIQGGVRSGHAKGLRLFNNRNGADLTGYIAPVVFEDSVIASDPGLSTGQGSGFQFHEWFAVLRKTTIRGFPYGVASTSAIVRLTGSTITGNATALLRGSSNLPYLESSGDNIIRGNTDDALGALTPVALR